MRVKVRLFASLAATVPGASAGLPLEVELPPGSKVSDLALRLRLPEAEQKLFFVNGRSEGPDRELKEDDEIGVFPPVGGG